MSNRKNISGTLLRELKAFYKGRRCVISKNDANTDWHHLDENSSNTTFVNLVPICRDYNNLLEQYRRFELKIDSLKGCDPDFSPESIICKSRHYFLCGEVALAYGCARLASWMCRRYSSLFQQEENHIQYSLRAMYYARHSAKQNLMIDIIERDFIPYVQTSISSNEKIQLLEEMASIYQEYGCNEKAKDLFDLINSKKISICTEGKYLQETRFLRRSAIINIQEISNISDALDKLKEADKYAKDSNTKVGIMNAIAWAKMSTNNAIPAIDILKPIIDKIFTQDGLPNTLLVAPWNAIETLLTYNGALLMVEKKNQRIIKKIENQLKYIAKIHGAENIQLRPLAYRLSSQFKGQMIPQIGQFYIEIASPKCDIMNFELDSILKKVINRIKL